MNIEYFKEPFDHLIIRDCFDLNTQTKLKSEIEFIQNVCFEEINKQHMVLSYDGNEYQKNTTARDGTAIDNSGDKLSTKKTIFLDEMFVDLSKLALAKNLNFFISKNIKPNNFFTSVLSRSILNNISVSFWLDGDYYKQHTDSSTLTGMYYVIPSEKEFEGGELCFGEYLSYKFKPLNNSMIFFPSWILHSVSKINVLKEHKKNDVVRTGITFWLGL